VVAFDLAGAEYNFPAKDHKEAFQLILNNNVNCTAHAGEAYGPESIAQAIHYCGAHRIGHGTRLRENGDLLNYVNDHRIPLEVCLSSNVQTRAVSDFAAHPLPFYYNYGLRVTINTDNRLVTNTTVSKELLLAHQHYGFSLDDIKEMIISGFKSAFLPYREKADVLKEINRELEQFQLPPNGQNVQAPIPNSRPELVGAGCADVGPQAAQPASTQPTTEPRSSSPV
jgi:adenosine deaminase